MPSACLGQLAGAYISGFWHSSAMFTRRVNTAELKPLDEMAFYDPCITADYTVCCAWLFHVSTCAANLMCAHVNCDVDLTPCAEPDIAMSMQKLDLNPS